jgi:uncharacterized protein
MHEYVWVCVIFFLAGFSQGLSGFGSILVSIPLLSILLDIKTVIPLTALAGVVVSGILLHQLRQVLDWKRIYPFLLGAILGVPVGVFFLKVVDKTLIEWVLGLTLVSYSVYGILFNASRGKKVELSDIWAYPFGFAAGCLAGVFSAAAPPIIIYMSLQAWSKDEVKSTLQGFLLVTGLAVVFFHSVTGLLSWTVLRLFAVSVPPLTLGARLGSALYGKVSETSYRNLMYVLLGTLGIYMLCRA